MIKDHSTANRLTHKRKSYAGSKSQQQGAHRLDPRPTFQVRIGCMGKREVGGQAASTLEPLFEVTRTQTLGTRTDGKDMDRVRVRVTDTDTDTDANANADADADAKTDRRPTNRRSKYNTIRYDTMRYDAARSDSLREDAT